MGPQVCKPCLAPLLIQVYTVKIPVCPQKTVLIRNCLCHIEISHTIGLCQLLQHLVIHCNPLIVYIGAFFFLPGADRQNGLENDLRLRMIGLQPFYQLCTLIAEGIGSVPAQLIDAQHHIDLAACGFFQCVQQRHPSQRRGYRLAEYRLHCSAGGVEVCAGLEAAV